MSQSQGKMQRAQFPLAAATRQFSLPSEAITSPQYVKHRSVMPSSGKYPFISPDAFVAPSATVLGDVKVNSQTSIWYNAVVMGDKNEVKVGSMVSIGDRVVIKTCSHLPSGFPAVVDIRKGTTIGAGSVLSSCTVLEGCIVGENCVVLEGALVEPGVTLAPGTVVPPGRRIPANQHWAGNPAEFVADGAAGVEKAKREVEMAAEHADEFLPMNSVPLNV